MLAYEPALRLTLPCAPQHEAARADVRAIEARLAHGRDLLRLIGDEEDNHNVG